MQCKYLDADDSPSLLPKGCWAFVTLMTKCASGEFDVLGYFLRQTPLLFFSNSPARRCAARIQDVQYKHSGVVRWPALGFSKKLDNLSAAVEIPVT
jgi:hypothetical protein